MQTTHTTNNQWWKVIEAAIDRNYRKCIQQKKDIKVLDLGCGDGTNIFRLFKINPTAEYYGLDIDAEALKKAEATKRKQNIKNIHFEKRNIITEDFPKVKFDFVLCSEVLEHLYDNEKVILMNKINACLKTDGDLVVTTPTPECFFRRVYESDNKIIKKMVNSVFKNTYKDRILADFSHGRHHHIGVCDSWYYKKLFYRKGFKVVRIEPTRAFQFEMPKIISEPINFFFITLNPWPNTFSASLVYICKKKSDILVEY